MSASSDSRLKYLFERYFDGTNTQEEKEELLELIHQAKHDPQLKDLMDQVWDQLSPAYRLNEVQSKRILSGILPTFATGKQKAKGGRLRLKQWSVAAASIVVLLVAGWMWYQHSIEENAVATAPQIVQSKKDIAPGGNKAVLTLGNGKTIVLDSNQTGLVTLQGKTKIIKTGNGLLTYQKSQVSDIRSQIKYNTITTPRGGRYQVVLPDGTKVWLNAASSLRFPTAFAGNKRIVEMTGEAYFDVAKNADKPFFVFADGMKVKVLGTQFNIMSYDNEPVVKTTLLEGSVMLTLSSPNGEGPGVRLKPGQQAQVSPEGKLTTVKNVDLQGIVAWKNNQFWFNDDDIQTVMRELSRWYDVDVVIRGNIPQHFGGTISRDIYVSKVFEALQATGHLQYKIQDSTIIVSP